MRWVMVMEQKHKNSNGLYSIFKISPSNFHNILKLKTVKSKIKLYLKLQIFHHIFFSIN